MSKRKKYTAEFEIKSSPTILYNYISTPSGLSEWFANDVDIKQNKYLFKWEGSQSEAELVRSSPNRYVRFKWDDAPDEEYFEMEIQQDELTGDVALIITDFANEGDVASATQLWESQIQDLKMAIGS